MRLLLVEDHDLLAHTLQLALGAAGHDVQRVSPSGPLALRAAVAEHGPELVLLDLDLGDQMPPGEDLIDDLNGSGAAVLMVTGTDDPVRIATGLGRGAAGYVPKTAGLKALCDAVSRVAEGLPATPPDILAALQHQLRAQEEDLARRLAPLNALSTSEQEVLQGLIDGAGADQLADQRHVSVATIRSQIRSVLRKLDVHSQLEAVALAHRVGWPVDQQ